MSPIHPARRVMETGTAIFVAFILMAALFVVMPPAQAASFGDMGAKVVVGSSDFVPTLTATLPVGGAWLGYRQVSVDHRAWYLHLGAAGDTVIEQGKSFRLNCGTTDATCPTKAQAGKWVRAGDLDLATPAFATGLVAFADRIRYLESDGRPGWTGGDGLYADVSTPPPGAASGVLAPGDVRIVPPSGFSCTTCPKGAVVKAGDTDLTQTTIATSHPLSATFATGAFDFLWFDGHNDGAIGFRDVFYLKGPSAPTHNSRGPNSVHPDVGDARITELASNDYSSTVEFGTLVAAGNPDYKRTVTLLDDRTATNRLAGIAVANGPPGESDFVKQHLFLSFTDPDGTNDHIRVGDIALYKGPSGGSAGQIVTAKEGTVATTPGHGTGVDVFRASIASYLRFHDVHGNGYTAIDPIYLKNPQDGLGGWDGSVVQIGDLRITGRSELGYATGTLVKAGDTDLGHALTDSANLVIKRYNHDGGNEPKLNALSGIYRSGFAGDRWTPATEGLYHCSSGTPTAVDTGCTGTMTRLFAPGETAMTAVTCPGDGDCGDAVEAYDRLSVTGPDTTWDAASSEYIYDRTVSTRITVGDQRVNAQGPFAAGSTVAQTDADAAQPTITSTDAVLITFDPTCSTPGPNTCRLPFFRVGDTFLTGASFGSRVTQSTTGFVPVLVEHATETAGDLYLARLNRGDSTSVVDDVFYGTLTTAATLNANDFRTTPITQTLRAGTVIKTSDSTFNQEVGPNLPVTVDAARLTTRVCHIDVVNRAGVSAEDPIYILAAGLGAPFNADTTRININDLRITPYPATGSKSHEPGTIILPGAKDLTSGQTTCATKPAGLTWYFRYFDQNGNNVFDSSGAAQTNDDVGYLALTTSLNHAPPPLHAVRVTGPGGAQSSAADPSTPTDPGTPQPVASFTTVPDPPIVLPGVNIVFDAATSSAPSERTLTNYAWTFGDGTSASGATLVTPSHVYAAEGSYTVQLTVTDSTGETATTSGTVFVGEFPSQPLALTAVSGVTSVELSWSPPEDDGGHGISHYTVKWGTTPGGPYDAGSQTTSDTSFTVPNLLPDITYYFVVSATNAIGEGPDSAEVSPIVLEDEGRPPSPPLNLQASSPSRSEVRLQWDAPADDGGSPITGYTVKWGTNQGGPYTETQEAKTTSAMIEGLEQGTEYFFVVSATNEAGEGRNSEEASETVQTPGPAVVVLLVLITVALTVFRRRR